MATRSYRNNNPGNLKTSKWVKSLPGYVGEDDKGFAVFESEAFGLSAMIRLLWGPNYLHHTIREAIYQYSKTDQESYVEFVCNEIGMSPLIRIDEMNLFDRISMIVAMIKMEGWDA